MSEFDIIHIYTRKQALEDGVLVDVTKTALEAGFRRPVALTQAVYEHFVRVPEGVEAQDEAGRLWDILWMLRHAIARSRFVASSTSITVDFALHVRNDNAPGEPPLVQLKAIYGPGDSLNEPPVFTVMLPEED